MSEEFLFIIFLAGFFYLFFRINKIEKLLNKYKEQQPLLKEEETKQEIPPSPEAPKGITETILQEEIIKPPLPPSLEKSEVPSSSEEPLDRELEFKLGGRIATGIGAFALIIGIGFFLRYAFENNLINETTRVILGIFAGLAFLVTGEFAVKRFPTYGQIVTGAGLGILYLSLYAAFNVYEILPQAVAFLGMVIVTAIGVFLAIKHNAPPLAGFAQLGGFITPLLLSSGENNPHALFLYLTILNISMLAIARWKLWRFLNFISFAGTVLIYFLWFIKYYTTDQFLIAEGYATLFFIIFFITSLLSHFIQKSKQNEIDIIFTVLNSALYFLISFCLINPLFPHRMGIFTAILALIYFITAFSLKKTAPENFLFQQFLLGIGFIFAVLAIPLQFDKIWITIGWAVEALVLILIGFQTRSKILRLFSQAIFLMVIFRLLFSDRVLIIEAGPWFNERFLVFIISLLSLIGAAFLYNYKKSEISEEENYFFSFLFIESGIVFLGGVSLEIYDFFSRWLLPIFWSISAAILLVLAFSLRNFPARIFAIIVLVVALIRLIFIDYHLPSDAEPWLNTRFYISLVISLVSGSFLFVYNNLRDRLKEDEFNISSSVLLITLYALLLWTFSCEIKDFHAEFWFPICWSIGAVLGSLVAFAQKNNPLRLASYATLILIFFRLLLYENKILDFEQYSPIFNTRFLVFIISAVAFGIILFLINRNKENLLKDEFNIIQPSLFLGINFLLLLLLSSEIIDYFEAKLNSLSSLERQSEQRHFDNLKNTALSVAWTLYAITLLIIGIYKKSIYSRFLAILLFGVIIFKVFLFDTANLNNYYRFISFVTLGLILLLTGFLYYRFRDRITQFIKGEDGKRNVA